jgi:signal transduction histidine kinase
MNKLWVQLAGIFLIVALVAVGAVAIVVNQTTESSFRSYVDQQNMMNSSGDMIESLEALYRDTGSWDGAQDILARGHGMGMGMGMGQGQQSFLVDTNYEVIAATDTAQVGRSLNRGERDQAVALVVDDRTVGYFLRQTQTTQALNRAQQDFLDDVSNALALTTGIAVILAVSLGIVFAWVLIRPLRYLRQSAAQIAQGDLGAQTPVLGTAEFRDVAAAFNQMSAALADSEAARQRMTSDIAHELRSPVSVMRGQLEAMMDGMFPLSLEQVAVVYDQTLHLGRLVEDLRTLTRAESDSLPLNKTSVHPGDLVQRVTLDFTALAQDQAVELVAHVDPDLPPIQADSDRLRQVLANLIANALRYTPSGGRVNVSAVSQVGSVRFTVSDTGPGLTAEQSRHVFERFYRTDEARQRDQSGSGLGLAITRELVRLHGGRIWVESVVGQGSQFNFEIPQ